MGASKNKCSGEVPRSFFALNYNKGLLLLIFTFCYLLYNSPTTTFVCFSK